MWSYDVHTVCREVVLWFVEIADLNVYLSWSFCIWSTCSVKQRYVVHGAQEFPMSLIFFAHYVWNTQSPCAMCTLTWEDEWRLSSSWCLLYVLLIVHGYSLHVPSVHLHERMNGDSKIFGGFVLFLCRLWFHLSVLVVATRHGNGELGMERGPVVTLIWVIHW